MSTCLECARAAGPSVVFLVQDRYTDTTHVYATRDAAMAGRTRLLKAEGYREDEAITMVYIEEARVERGEER